MQLRSWGGQLLWSSIRRQVHHVVEKSPSRRQPKAPDSAKLRNVGIVAHIDAGKTTTTERMLYLSGASTSMGSVDSGDTTTDYLTEERERGITINSAAVTFNWREHRINLIDTPGHVDFGVEVERSVRVLDGCVLVLDAAAGVEAQTLTVWQQCLRYAVPAIVFVNKMDKQNANYSACLDAIESLLSVRALPLFVPVHNEAHKLTGCVDVLRNAALSWYYKTEPPQVNVLEQRSPSVQSMYDRLLDVTGDHDDQLADLVLAEGKLDVDQHLVPAIRRATLSGGCVPVVCGSSLQAIGVSTLLDAIVQYLPSPADRHHSFSEFYGQYLCAFSFKTEHDRRLGALTYVRLYNGELIKGSHVYNVTQNVTEVVQHVYVPYANQLKEVQRVPAGHICVLGGLKHTKTGDTLAETDRIAQKAAKQYESQEHSDDVLHEVSVTPHGLSLMGISVHEPVFFCTVEPERLSDGPMLDKALKHLATDDPSIIVREDSESGQLILETQGELHMEVIKARLRDEYKIEVFLGNIQINYKEVPLETVEGSSTMNETLQDRAQHCSIRVRLIPSKGSDVFHRLKFSQEQGGDNLAKLRGDWLSSIKKGCALALMQGPLLHNHVVDVDVMLMAVDISARCTPALISAAASRAVADALANARVALLEPVMMVELGTYDHSVGLQDIVDQLTNNRRAHIVQMNEARLSPLDFRGVKAQVPLSELSGFSNEVRRLSSGTVSVHMHKQGYWQLDEQQQQQIINRLTR